ncbi:unnamed protein product, partial [Allacma fusca]
FFMVIILSFEAYVASEDGEQRMGENNHGIMFQIMGYIYVVFPLAFYYSVSKGHLIGQILNDMHSFSVQVLRGGGDLPSRKTCRAIGAVLLILCMSKGLHYVVIGWCEEYPMDWDDFPSLLKYLGNAGVKHYRGTVCTVYYADTNCRTNLQAGNGTYEIPLSLTILSGTLLMWLKFNHTMYWILAYLVIIQWSLGFCILIRRFFKLIVLTSSRNTLKDIGCFNELTSVIQKFNEVFGWTVLFCVLTGVAHFSVEIIQLHYTNYQGIHKQIIVWSMFFIFSGQLVVASHVNHDAYQVVEVFKTRFQNEIFWKKHHGPCVKTTQGILMVFHDLQTAYVGIHGYKFFTITYGFIGTVASVISTYAVVVAQCKN